MLPSSGFTGKIICVGVERRIAQFGFDAVPLIIVFDAFLAAGRAEPWEQAKQVTPYRLRRKFRRRGRSPVGMEEFAAGFVNSFVGVCAEIIALRL